MRFWQLSIRELRVKLIQINAILYKFLFREEFKDIMGCGVGKKGEVRVKEYCC